MPWIASKGNDDREDNESHNHAYFDTWEPEFEFPKDSDTEIVDENDEHKEYGDPYPGINSFSGHPISTVSVVRWTELL